MSDSHPMEALDWDLIEFWLNLVPGYKRSATWHDPIHKALIEPRYNDSGPVPTVVMLTGGIQAGKSTTGYAHMFATHWCSKILWIVGERYEDCRYEFQGLINAGMSVGALDPKNVSFPQNPGPSRAIFNNGCIVRTLASADVTTLASESPDGVLMVEAGRQSEQAFITLWERVSQRTGWLLVSGTIEQLVGRWFPDLWGDMQGDNVYSGKSFRLPSYVNPIHYPGGEYDPKIQAIRKTLSEEEFNERYLGIPRSIVGVVFPEFRRAVHVRNSAEFERSLPVRLWVDPGFYPSSYAVGFVQLYGPRIHIFDELYLQGMTNDVVVEQVVNHDAFRNVERVVIDIAAQSHAGAQDPAIEVWRRALAGRGIPVVAKFVKVEDGIVRTRDKLRMNVLDDTPFLIVHPRCVNTINEFLAGYRYHTRKASGAIAGDKPIDENNHMMKAIAYGIVDAYGVADLRRDPVPPRRGGRLQYGRRK